MSAETHIFYFRFYLEHGDAVRAQAHLGFARALNSANFQRAQARR
jgi:hypothetical protein